MLSANFKCSEFSNPSCDYNSYIYKKELFLYQLLYQDCQDFAMLHEEIYKR